MAVPERRDAANPPAVDLAAVQRELRGLARNAVLALAAGLAGAAVVASVLAASRERFVEPATLILYPVFAMALLVAIVVAIMGWYRIGSVLRGDMPIEFYRTFTDGEEPDAMRAVTRNFLNLFEMPVLFYVVAILAYVTRNATFWMVGLAWAYVALRYAHTWVHLTSNHVPTRLAFWASSDIVLVVMWATLFASLLRA